MLSRSGCELYEAWWSQPHLFESDGRLLNLERRSRSGGTADLDRYVDALLRSGFYKEALGSLIDAHGRHWREARNVARRAHSARNAEPGRRLSSEVQNEFNRHLRAQLDAQEKAFALANSRKLSLMDYVRRASNESDYDFLRRIVSLGFREINVAKLVPLGNEAVVTLAVPRDDDYLDDCSPVVSTARDLANAWRRETGGGAEVRPQPLGDGIVIHVTSPTSRN